MRPDRKPGVHVAPADARRSPMTLAVTSVPPLRMRLVKEPTAMASPRLGFGRQWLGQLVRSRNSGGQRN